MYLFVAFEVIYGGWIVKWFRWTLSCSDIHGLEFHHYRIKIQSSESNEGCILLHVIRTQVYHAHTIIVKLRCCVRVHRCIYGDYDPSLWHPSSLAELREVKDLDRKTHQFTYTNYKYTSFNDIIYMQPIRARGVEIISESPVPDPFRLKQRWVWKCLNIWN